MEQKNKKFILNIPEPVRTVFGVRDIANIIYSFLNFHEKIMFMFVSHQCKKWIRKRLLNNKLCDDLEEAILIKEKRSYVSKVLNIDPKLLLTPIYENYTLETFIANLYSKDNKMLKIIRVKYIHINFLDNILIDDYLIMNNCYIFLEKFYKYNLTIIDDRCRSYKIMYLHCLINNGLDLKKKIITQANKAASEQAIFFIHNILGLSSCNDLKCCNCLSVIKSIILNNFAIDSKFYCDDLDNLLIFAAVEGSEKTFESIYTIAKKFMTEDNLHIQLNNSLIMMCKNIYKHNYHCIIKFCLEMGADPYILTKIDNYQQSSFGLIYNQYISACACDDQTKIQNLIEIINYMIHQANKYSKVDVLQNSLLCSLNHIKKLENNKNNCKSLDLLFYVDHIELSDAFMKKFIKISIGGNNIFYSEYMNLYKKIFDIKLKGVSMSEYFEYVENISKFGGKLTFTSNSKMNNYSFETSRWLDN